MQKRPQMHSDCDFYYKPIVNNAWPIAQINAIEIRIFLRESFLLAASKSTIGGSTELKDLTL